MVRINVILFRDHFPQRRFYLYDLFFDDFSIGPRPYSHGYFTLKDISEWLKNLVTFSFELSREFDRFVLGIRKFIPRQMILNNPVMRLHILWIKFET